MRGARRTPEQLQARCDQDKGRLTEWLKPFKKIESQYGNIFNKSWVDREARRMGGFVVEREDGKLAIYAKGSRVVLPLRKVKEDVEDHQVHLEAVKNFK